jgi:hypothetical protein
MPIPLKALLFFAVSVGFVQANASNSVLNFVGKYQLLEGFGQNAKQECDANVEITIQGDELKVPVGFVKISMINQNKDYVSSGGGMNDRRTRWTMTGTDTLTIADRFIRTGYEKNGSAFVYDSLKITRTLSLTNQYNGYPARPYVPENTKYQTLEVSETASSIYSNSFSCLYLKK